MIHSNKQKERYGKLLSELIKPLFEKYGLKMCRRNYLKIPKKTNTKICHLSEFEEYWSEDVIVLTSLGPITMFYKKCSGKYAKLSRFEHSWTITEKDAIVNKFLWKKKYLKYGIQNKIEIIAKGIENGLPDIIIENQVNRFKALYNEKSFYEEQYGILYKLIPCEK